MPKNPLLVVVLKPPGARTPPNPSPARKLHVSMPVDVVVPPTVVFPTICGAAKYEKLPVPPVKFWKLPVPPVRTFAARFGMLPVPA
jgi:hypothetical protein